MKHTPGPWHDQGGGHIVARHNMTESQRFDIAKVFGGMDDEGTANAHLIVAAPDLLEALKAYIDCRYNDYTDAHYVPEDVIAMAQAAIAKAEGH